MGGREGGREREREREGGGGGENVFFEVLAYMLLTYCTCTDNSKLLFIFTCFHYK